MNNQRGPKLKQTLLCAGLMAGLAACAAQPQSAPPSPQAEAASLKAFAAGGARLTCGAGCAEVWRRSQSDVSRLYQEGDWQALARQVIQINYNQDLGYFYLGRAAEGLGRRNAAHLYYREAIALATGPDVTARCAASSAGCNGLNLLTEALIHSNAVTTPRDPARATAKRSSGAADQAAPDGWVDPAPVGP